MIIKLSTLPSTGWKADLPSEFEVDPFSGKQSRLISQAIEEKDMLPMVEALSQVTNIDVGLLSIPDFHSILLTMRLNMKAPFFLPWQCNNPIYEYTDGSYLTLQEDRNLVTARPCGAQTASRLDASSFTIRTLEKFEEDFDLPRVMNLEKAHSSMFDWIAAHLMPNHNRAVATLEDQPDLELWHRLVAWSKASTHGINSTLGCQCGSCERMSPVIYEMTAEIFA